MSKGNSLPCVCYSRAGLYVPSMRTEYATVEDAETPPFGRVADIVDGVFGSDRS